MRAAADVRLSVSSGELARLARLAEGLESDARAYRNEGAHYAATEAEKDAKLVRRLVQRARRGA